MEDKSSIINPWPSLGSLAQPSSRWCMRGGKRPNYAPVPSPFAAYRPQRCAGRASCARAPAIRGRPLAKIQELACNLHFSRETLLRLWRGKPTEMEESMNEFHHGHSTHPGRPPHARRLGQRGALPGNAGPEGGHTPPCWASLKADTHGIPAGCGHPWPTSSTCQLRPARKGTDKTALTGHSLPIALHGYAAAQTGHTTTSRTALP